MKPGKGYMGVIFTVFVTFQKSEFISKFKVTEREKETEKEIRETYREEIEGIDNRKKRCSLCLEFFFNVEIQVQEGQYKQDK